jgi:hypothetical protein
LRERPPCRCDHCVRGRYRRCAVGDGSAVIGLDAGDEVFIAVAEEGFDPVAQVIAAARFEGVEEIARPGCAVVLEGIVEVGARHGSVKLGKRLVEDAQVLIERFDGIGIDDEAFGTWGGAFDALNAGSIADGVKAPMPSGPSSGACVLTYFGDVDAFAVI